MTKAQSKLNIPINVVETSSQLYRQALNANIIRGRTIQSIASACIYLACRQCGVVRSIEEVAYSFELEKKDLARNYRFLVKTLTPKVPKVNTEGYISKLVSKLDLTGSTEMTAIAILDTASEMRLTGGRGPAGMAAACIYISTRLTNELRTQGDIARVAQVTEVTIRNRYKELLEELEIEIYL
jgi:transcription initiation factor TFIIB